MSLAFNGLGTTCAAPYARYRRRHRSRLRACPQPLPLPPSPASRDDNCFNPDTGEATRTACFANKRIRAERRETCVDFNRSRECSSAWISFGERDGKLFVPAFSPLPPPLRSIIESARALTCSFDLVYNVLTHRDAYCALCNVAYASRAHVNHVTGKLSERRKASVRAGAMRLMPL